MKAATIKFATGSALALAVAISGSPAAATENGGSIYPNGVENFMTGAIPPPGFYTLLYGTKYNANELRDNDGNKIPLDFHVDANALATRFVWVTNNKILGGDALHSIILPLVNLDVSVAGQRQKATGLGDITLTLLGIAWHHSPNLHSVLAFEVNAPTGRYNKTDLANLGRNYWNLEPLYAVTYTQPRGLNADIKLMYDFNAKNRDTRYQSGQEFHFDYALGWGFGNHWVAGAGGYFYQQTTDDKVDGATLANNKGRTFAIGPSIKFDDGNGNLLTLKWQQETAVRNRAKGNAVMLKWVMPF